MEQDRPFILTIAGFDPSGGAGLLADCKTFEQHKVYGQAVCTSITFQNENEFEGLRWVPAEEILQQIELLSRKRSFEWVKIGLIQNLEVLEIVIQLLLKINPACKIVWDPILKASVGFEFHTVLDLSRLQTILRKITLVTPNQIEILSMSAAKESAEAAKQLASYCAVLLKGGHALSAKAIDQLFFQQEVFSIVNERVSMDKHGTGCVLSAAILSNLANGMSLLEACTQAKDYISRYIQSHNSLLGFHYA